MEPKTFYRCVACSEKLLPHKRHYCSKAAVVVCMHCSCKHSHGLGHSCRRVRSTVISVGNGANAPVESAAKESAARVGEGDREPVPKPPKKERVTSDHYECT